MEATIHSQKVRYREHVFEFETAIINNTEYLFLDDVQRRFLTVTSFSIDDVQLGFIRDDHGDYIHPLRITVNKNKIIDAIEPITNSEKSVDNIFNKFNEQIERMEKKTDLILANTQETLMRTKQIMTQMYELHEFTTPRYFFILPVKQTSFSPIDRIEHFFNHQYKLYFLCECSTEPDKLHLAPHDGYLIKRPSEFINAYGSYLQTMLSIARNVLCVSGYVIPTGIERGSFISDSLSPILQDSNLAVDVDKKLEMVETILDKQNRDLVQVSGYSFGHDVLPKITLRDSKLRELEAFLEHVDGSRSLGNLYRTVTDDGHVRWLCAEHANSTAFNNKIFEYIRQCEAMGGKYIRETRQLLISGSLTAKNIDVLCEALTKGFNPLTIVLDTCSLFNLDFDRLIDKIINQSSVQRFILKSTEIHKWRGMSRYICDHLVFHIRNQSMKIYFSRSEQGQGSRTVMRLLDQNKICASFEFFGPDLFVEDTRFLQYLRTIQSIKNLTINYPIQEEFLHEILRNQSSIICLKLCHCFNSSSNILNLCRALENNRTLNELDLLDQMPISDSNALVELFRTVQKHSSIQTLRIHVDHIEPSSRNETLLMAALSYDSYIQHLRISKSIISEDLVKIFLQIADSTNSLKSLEFYNCRFDGESLTNLEKNNSNTKLSNLLISEQTYWSALFDETVQQYQNSSVPYRNEILESKIATCNQRSSIFLDDMKLTDLDINIVIEQALVKKECLLLSLQSSKLTLNSILILSYALTNNEILESLYLGNSQITDDALYFITNAINNEKNSIKNLVLQNNRISDRGVSFLTQILETNRKLIWLYLGENQITDEGVRLLMKALSNEESVLEMLVLSSNRRITDKSIDYILVMTQTNKSLKKLWIENCSFSESVKNTLTKIETTRKDFYVRV